jgi:hypothetical protein
VATGATSFCAITPAASPADVQAAITQANSLQPTLEKPFTIAETDLDLRKRWTQVIDDYIKLPAEQVTAHPVAADFPGDVAAGSPRISRSFDFPLNLPRWESTGLYAAPGEKITIRVSPEDSKRKLSVVVGAHTDSCFAHDKWIRFPRISRKFEITQPVTVVANAFGGLIYIEVPRNPGLGGHHFDTYGGYAWLDETRTAVTGQIHVQIDGAAEAPLYRLGKTTPQEWRRMRALGAPWGELAGDKMIFTFKTSTMTNLENPIPLLQFWDKVVTAEAELAGWPAPPAPPERLVVDRDISAGYMHSGYPIMAHLESARDMLNVTTLSTKGDWGVFHELGHNHEGQAYTFGADYVEVDVNLFSMYIMQKVVGREMTAHPALKNIDDLLVHRLGPEKKIDPWTNLAMYIKTIQAFGWEPLHKTLAQYSAPGGSDGIKTREQKMDQWVLRYSQATGHNLAPYYAAFDVTCSPETLAAIKSLPPWLPTGLPKAAASK